MERINSSVGPGAENSDNATEIRHLSGQGLKITIVHFLIGIFVCLLNLMCFIAILKGRLHREENRFLFMAILAMADSLFGFSLLFSGAVSLTTDNHTLCAIGSILMETTIWGDVLCICLITADQFMRIELHMKYLVYATFRNACLALVGIFILFSVHLLSAVLAWYHWSDGHCVFVLLPTWYHAYNLVFYLLIPIMIIVGMHLRIFYISWTQTKKLANLAPTVCLRNDKSTAAGNHEMQHHETSQRDNLPDSTMGVSGRTISKTHHEHKPGTLKVCPCGHNNTFEARRQWKTVVTLTVFVGVLLCTWLPAAILMSLFTLWPEYSQSMVSLHMWMDLSGMLSFVNPLFNPFIYIARFPEVKKEFKRMVPLFIRKCTSGRA